MYLVYGDWRTGVPGIWRLENRCTWYLEIGEPLYLVSGELQKETLILSTATRLALEDNRDKRDRVRDKRV